MTNFNCPKCHSTNTRISQGTPPHALRWDCNECSRWGWMVKDEAINYTQDKNILMSILWLANSCNFASSVDGSGFSKFDASEGHRIARAIKSSVESLAHEFVYILSDEDYSTAVHFAHKYRKQLDGIDFTQYVVEIKEVPQEQKHENIFDYFGESNIEDLEEDDRTDEEYCDDDEEDCLEYASVISDNQQGLNEGQREAFKGILNWFYAKDESPDQSVLKGWAGCGKTFLVQRVAKELKERGHDILFCAPTHKANNVLRTMAFNVGLSVKCETIHRIAGLKMELNSDGKHQPEKQRDGYFTDYDLVVADECSMISKQLYSEFPKYTERTKILFMGDPDQLPPINEEQGSLTFKLDTQFKVTEVMRFSGLIGEYTSNIRANMAESTLPNIDFDETFFRASNGVWLKKILDTFIEARDSDELYVNPDGIRVLSYTNKRVNRLNQDIRNALYGAESFPYFRGERLMAKKNISQYRGGAEWNNGSKYTFMSPCAECEVLKFEFVENYPVYMPTEFEEDELGNIKISGHKYFTFAVWALELFTDVRDRSFVNVLDARDRDKATHLLLTWREAIKNIPQKHLRTSQWAEWYKACDSLTIYFDGNQLSRKLQYAFCLTIHQSQGSTFETVFADSDVYWQKDVRQRNQLLYVQGSRASKRLILNSGF